MDKPNSGGVIQDYYRLLITIEESIVYPKIPTPESSIPSGLTLIPTLNPEQQRFTKVKVDYLC